MKTILIAYDGSECSEAIIASLKHAGLPAQLEAHVVTVGEASGASAVDPAADPAAWAALAPAVLRYAQWERAQALQEAGALAGQGAARLQAAFPAWGVVAAGPVGSAARAIVQRSREVSADMIFIGSHSRSAVGRCFLGSVSQKVAAEAKCSVRICRPRPSTGTAPRLLVAVDGSLPSQAAVRAVAGRAWPAGTVVAVVSVIEPAIRPGGAGLPSEFSDEILRRRKARLDWLEAVGIAAHRQLELPGLAPNATRSTASQYTRSLNGPSAGTRTVFSSAPPVCNIPTPKPPAPSPRRWPSAPTARWKSCAHDLSRNAEQLTPLTVSTMLAADFHGVNDIRVESVPKPTAGPGEAVLRISATTICGTDLHIVRGEYPGKPGLITGHEPEGVIEEPGPSMLVTGRFSLAGIKQGYEVFGNRAEGLLKVLITPRTTTARPATIS